MIQGFCQGLGTIRTNLVVAKKEHLQAWVAVQDICHGLGGIMTNSVAAKIKPLQA